MYKINNSFEYGFFNIAARNDYASHIEYNQI